MKRETEITVGICDLMMVYFYTYETLLWNLSWPSCYIPYGVTKLTASLLKKVLLGMPTLPINNSILCDIKGVCDCVCMHKLCTTRHKMFSSLYHNETFWHKNI